MRLMRAIAIAFSTYSRIPMPRVDWSEENQRYSMCFFPLVGLAVGLALWLWLWLCDLWALGAFARGALGAALPLLVSGGIHMDGFMDTLDAMASWQPREKRLEILKDVHTGAFAVMGCGAYLLVMAGILSEARAGQGLAIAACFVLSRAQRAGAGVGSQGAHGRHAGGLCPHGKGKGRHGRVLRLSRAVRRGLSLRAAVVRRAGAGRGGTVRGVLFLFQPQVFWRHHGRYRRLVFANFGTGHAGRDCADRGKIAMKLYVGGAFQGQEELARRENPGAEIWPDFHETVRAAMARGEEPGAFARGICASHADAVIVANEVGAGIVPIDPGERAYREGVGRALCAIAQNSESVTRAVCGIGVRLK